MRGGGCHWDQVNLEGGVSCLEQVCNDFLSRSAQRLILKGFLCNNPKFKQILAC